MKRILIGLLIGAASLVMAGEIADLHRQQTQGKRADWGKSRRYNDVVSTNHGITEIGIERTGCLGRCPVYTLIIKSDGSFRYKGMASVPRIGELTGTIPLWEFIQMAWFIRDSGYMELEDSYSAMVTDHSTVYTTVVMDGKRKTISNYASGGPTKLWAIEQLIDHLLTNAKWKEAEIKAKQGQ